MSVSTILALDLLSAVNVDLVEMCFYQAGMPRGIGGVFLCCCCLLLATGKKVMRDLGRNFTVHQVSFYVWGFPGAGGFLSASGIFKSQ